MHVTGIDRAEDITGLKICDQIINREAENGISE